MADILKSNVQSDAHTYIVESFNSFPNNPAGPGPNGAERNITYCNNIMLDFYSFDPEQAWLASYLSGNIQRSQLVARVQNLGALLARTTWGMWGLTGTTSSGSWDGFTVPFNNIDIFFVKPSFHQAHYDSVVAAVNADGASELFNNITRTGIISYFTRIKNIVLNNATSGDVVDLRICHSSCHSNCHGSRGRR